MQYSHSYQHTKHNSKNDIHLHRLTVMSLYKLSQSVKKCPVEIFSHIHVFVTVVIFFIYLCCKFSK